MSIFCGNKEVQIQTTDHIENHTDDDVITGTYKNGTITILMNERDTLDVLTTICHEFLHMLNDGTDVNLSHEQIYSLSERLRVFLAQNPKEQ